mgnify:CR=1 FL=1
MLYIVTFTINIPQMLVSIYTIHGYTWILWVMNGGLFVCILCILMIPSLDVSISCVEKGCFRKLGTVPQ